MFTRRCIFDAGVDLYGAAVVATGFDVDLEDPLQTLRPSHGDAAFGGRWVWRLGLVAVAPARHHLCAPVAVRGKDTVKSSEVHSGLGPFEKFAAMIEPHWDGIVSYCKPENKVSLGCVEGLNNTIRVIQRKAYGFRDEEYLAMKIITHFLPALPDHAKITHTNPR